jgi:chromosome segregation ATPase
MDYRFLYVKCKEDNQKLIQKLRDEIETLKETIIDCKQDCKVYQTENKNLRDLLEEMRDDMVYFRDKAEDLEDKVEFLQNQKVQ